MLFSFFSQFHYRKKVVSPNDIFEVLRSELTNL